jgi:AAHS family 3-hydroxyphenylpropionic acid transporter
VGAAVVMGRLGSAIGPLLAGALLATGRSPAQVLLTLLPILAVGGLLCVWLANRPTATEEDG